MYVVKLAVQLPLVRAMRILNAVSPIYGRRHVGVTHRECRRLVNYAAALTITAQPERAVKLCCFDGDQTLYDQGGGLVGDDPGSRIVLQLLRQGVAVALVTAAGCTLLTPPS